MGTWWHNSPALVALFMQGPLKRFGYFGVPKHFLNRIIGNRLFSLKVIPVRDCLFNAHIPRISATCGRVRITLFRIPSIGLLWIEILLYIFCRLKPLCWYRYLLLTFLHWFLSFISLLILEFLICEALKGLQTVFFLIFEGLKWFQMQTF